MEIENKVPYGFNKKKITQLFAAGFVATIAMVVVSQVIRAVGIPSPDYAILYGTILNNQARPLVYDGMWWVGLLWHAISGIFVFSFLYDYLAHRMILPNRPRVKGLIYAVGISLVTSLLIAPLAGVGVFFQYMAYPWVTTIANLVCWMVYGLVLDEMTRVRVVHQLKMVERQAA